MSSQTHRYMGAEVPLTTLPNGARTNADALERLARTSYLAPIADRVAPGVTVFGGDGLLNPPLIGRLGDRLRLVALPSRLWTCAGPAVIDAIEMLIDAAAAPRKPRSGP